MFWISGLSWLLFLAKRWLDPGVWIGGIVVVVIFIALVVVGHSSKEEEKDGLE